MKNRKSTTKSQKKPKDKTRQNSSAEKPGRYFLAASIFVWILLALGIPGSVHVMAEGASLLALPYETTRPESFVLNGASRIADGLPLYPEFGKEPYVIHVYNPLTYLPAGIAGRLFSLDLQEMLVVGRVFSYAATVLLGALLCFFVWRKNRDWKSAAFVGAALLFFHTATLTDFFRMRPESPGMLFTFAGVVLFLSESKHRIYLSAAFFFAAFLFKQPYIAAPVSAFAFLVLSKDFKRAGLFAAALGGLLAVFLVAMHLFTGGNYFKHAFLSMAVNDVRPFKMLFDIHGPKLWDGVWGLCLAVVPALGALYSGKGFKFLHVYFFICLSWTVYSAGKYGASLNYFSELAILSCLVAALASGRTGQKKAWLPLAAMALVSVQVGVAVFRSGIYGPDLNVYKKDITPYVEKYRDLPGELLITHEGIAVRTGRIVGFDWYLLDHLEKKGYVNLAPLFSKISSGRFSTVVLGRRMLTRLEKRIAEAVEKGPYKVKYWDSVVSEWALARK